MNSCSVSSQQRFQRLPQHSILESRKHTPTPPVLEELVCVQQQVPGTVMMFSSCCGPEALNHPDHQLSS